MGGVRETLLYGDVCFTILETSLHNRLLLHNVCLQSPVSQAEMSVWSVLETGGWGLCDHRGLPPEEKREEGRS